MFIVTEYAALSLSLYFYHIMNGDNVKIYMHMMDLEYSEKVFVSLKKIEFSSL